MKRLLRVSDVLGGVFLRMADVLAALPPEVHELRWSILDLGDVVADESTQLDVGELERKVFGSPTGLELSFAELSRFAAETIQVIDGRFLGRSRAAASPQRSDADVAILDESDVVVAPFDSTFWLISANDAALDHIARRFDAVSEEDPASTPLRAWGPTP